MSSFGQHCLAGPDNGSFSKTQSNFCRQLKYKPVESLVPSGPDRSSTLAVQGKTLLETQRRAGLLGGER